MSKVVIDLETTGTKEYGRTCNPLNPNHEVNVYAEYRGPGTEPKIITDFASDLRPYLDLNLEGVTHIIGHNIKFDLLFLWKLPQLQEFIRNGGKIWDTMLAEYFIRGHKKGGLDLGSVAIKYGGHGKEDGIKELWDKGLTTKEIGKRYPEKFLTYAKYDVLDPWIIAAKQVKYLKKEERFQCCEIYMEHLLATIEMEFNGLKVNTELGYKRAKEIQDKSNQLLYDMQHLIQPIWTDKVEFSPTDRMVSAVLFGAPIETKTATYTDEAGEELEQVIKLGGISYETQIPNPSKSGETHYKSGKRKGELRTKKAKLLVEILGYGLPSKFSSKTKLGWYQVDIKVIGKLIKFIDGFGQGVKPSKKYMDAYKFLKLLSEYRKLEKILTTYYVTDPYAEPHDKQKGLLKLVHPDGLLHPELKATSTVTGRLASANPNGQNLNKPVYEMVESRWGEDGVIIEIDFANLEVVTKGAQSGCKQLLEDFQNGLDTHCLNTALALGLEYEEVYNKYKAGDKEMSELRRTIGKPITFEGEYGKRPEDTARDNGIKEELVIEAAEAKKRRYPEIFALEAEIEEDIKMSRRPDEGLLRIKKSKKYLDNELPKDYYYIQSADDFNIRNNKEGAAVGFYRNPFGQMWRYPEVGVLTTKGTTFRYFNGPIMKNYYNQGFAALIMKIASARVFREYILNHRDSILMILEVHDALYLDCRKNMVDIHVPKIKEIMESGARYLNAKFNTNLACPLRVDVGVGRTWLEAKEA